MGEQIKERNTHYREIKEGRAIKYINCSTIAPYVDTVCCGM